MSNNDTLTLIKILIKGAKKEGKKFDKKIEGGKDTYGIYNCKYLLNQTLRQYDIPKDHYHISKAAKKKWEELTSQDINDFIYDEHFKCDKVKSKNIEISFYQANKKVPNKRPAEPNESIKWNSVFHCEHVIPISEIVDKLLKMDDPSDKQIIDAINSIHICRILKEEDRKIKKNKAGTLNFEEAIKNRYTFEDGSKIDIL